MAEPTTETPIRDIPPVSEEVLGKIEESMEPEIDLDVDQLINTTLRARQAAVTSPESARRQEDALSEGKEISYPKSIGAVIPWHAKSLGLSEDDLWRAARKQGVPLDDLVDLVGRKNKTPEEARKIVAARGVTAVMPEDIRHVKEKGKEGVWVIELRHQKNRRCEGYCSVRKFCWWWNLPEEKRPNSYEDLKK